MICESQLVHNFILTMEQQWHCVSSSLFMKLGLQLHCFQSNCCYNKACLLQIAEMY